MRETLPDVRVLYNTYWVRFDHGASTFARAVAHTRALFHAAAEAGVERIVHVSITNPSLDSPLPYFRRKAQNEAGLRASGLSHAILRPAVFFGGRDILINNIAWLLLRLPVFGIAPGRYGIQPIHVEDMLNSSPGADPRLRRASPAGCPRTRDGWVSSGHPSWAVTTRVDRRQRAWSRKSMFVWPFPAGRRRPSVRIGFPWFFGFLAWLLVARLAVDHPALRSHGVRAWALWLCVGSVLVPVVVAAISGLIGVAPRIGAVACAAGATFVTTGVALLVLFRDFAAFAFVGGFAVAAVSATCYAVATARSLEAWKDSELP